jgi:hypothetical protein
MSDQVAGTSLAQPSLMKNSYVKEDFMDSSFLAHSSHFFWALSFNAIRPHSTHFHVMMTSL